MVTEFVGSQISSSLLAKPSNPPSEKQELATISPAKKGSTKVYVNPGQINNLPRSDGSSGSRISVDGNLVDVRKVAGSPAYSGGATQPSESQLNQEAAYQNKLSEYYGEQMAKGVDFTPDKIEALRKAGIIQYSSTEFAKGTGLSITPSGNVYTLDFTGTKSSTNSLPSSEISPALSTSQIFNVVSPSMFGGGSIAPSDTGIISKASMGIATTYQYLENVGRETSYAFISNKNIERTGAFFSGFAQAPTSKDFISGFTTGILKDIKEQPVKQAAIVGGGFALGFAIKGTGALIGTGSKAFGLNSEAILSTSGKGLGYVGTALGVGYLLQAVPDYAKLQTAKEKGAFIGVESKDFILFGAGTIVGSQSYAKIQDTIRVRGLKEFDNKDIIAPEYFKGQTYPLIKEGQTAGQLKKEFFNPIDVLGEKGKSPRGFTASPSELRGELQKGSSELYGGYFAPKLSPTFLRVNSEVYPTSFNFSNLLKTTKPTATRGSFIDIVFTRGVTSNQKNIAPYTKKLVEFFGGGSGKKARSFKLPKNIMPTAEKGKGYVPFIKTEKELVATYGSSINNIEPIGYFKFKGRKVLIEKADIGNLNKPLAIKSNIKISSSEYGTEKNAFLSPLSNFKPYIAGGSMRTSSGLSSSTSSSSNLIPSSRILSSGSSTSSSSNLIISFRSFNPTSSSSSYYKPPTSSRITTTYYPPTSSNKTLLNNGFKFDFFPTPKERKRKTGKARTTSFYTPDFTSRILGRTKSFKTSKQFKSFALKGSGFIRPIPKF